MKDRLEYQASLVQEHMLLKRAATAATDPFSPPAKKVKQKWTEAQYVVLRAHRNRYTTSPPPVEENQAVANEIGLTLDQVRHYVARTKHRIKAEQEAIDVEVERRKQAVVALDAKLASCNGRVPFDDMVQMGTILRCCPTNAQAVVKGRQPGVTLCYKEL